MKKNEKKKNNVMALFKGRLTKYNLYIIKFSGNIYLTTTTKKNYKRKKRTLLSI